MEVNRSNLETEILGSEKCDCRYHSPNHISQKVQITIQTKMTTTPKKVVILGLGYSGAAVAKFLEKFPKEVELTIVSPREFLLHKIAALRAATATNQGWRDRVMVPAQKSLKHAKFVKALAIRVVPNENKVELSNGQTLSYDILVVATGSRNFSPAEPPVQITSREETNKFYLDMKQQLSAANNIVIVGSGPVAIELAGEIREEYPDKKLTIVTRSKHVLHTLTPLPKKGIDHVSTRLEKNNIGLILNDEVISHPLPTDLLDGTPVVKITDRKGISLNSPFYFVKVL